MKLLSILTGFVVVFGLSASLCQIRGANPPEGGSGQQRGARQRSARTDSRAKASRVDALFAPWSRNGMPGAAVLVVQNGHILLKKGYGNADIKSNKPIRPDTSFLLGSTTKSFTALAIMILADRHRLSYDDPLSKFFPKFPRYAKDITVRDLLHHTAGLTEFEDLFGEEGRIDDMRTRSIKSRPSSYEPTAKDALKLLSRQKKLRFYPGEEFSYSNSGYVVLAQIVENRSGQRFREFVEDEIFRPLRMDHSLVYDETRPEVHNRATSYSWKDGKYRNVDYNPLNFIYGDDGIYTTLDDMVRWVKAIDKKRLVKAKTWKQAFTSGQLNNGKYTGYGYGWSVSDDYVWHNGLWLGFRSYIAHHPSAGLNVVVLSNCKELNATSLGEEVARIYLGDDD